LAQEAKPAEAKKVINGKAISLPKPEYPAAAKAVRASGTVSVKIVTDEEGNVIEAKGENGHPSLIDGKKVKVSGIITYNFVPKPGSNNPSLNYKFTWWGFGLHVGNSNFYDLKHDADWIKISHTDERNKLVEIIFSKAKDKLVEFGKTFSTKLVAKSISEWEFNAGFAVGTILENYDDDIIILRELANIKKLADSPNIFASKTRIEKLKELATFSDLKELTNNQMMAIADICYTIY
jgi:hypothetical protein